MNVASPSESQRLPVVYIFNVHTQQIELMENVSYDPYTGLPIAPVNYTACLFTPIFADQTTTVPTANPALNNNESNHSDATTTLPTENVKRKFPHRSKQVCITQTYEEIKNHFSPTGVYAEGEEDVLRGDDVCRVHVKNYNGLKQILDVLKQVYNHKDISLLKLATPISMKNKFQKKGFIVYMQVSDVSQVTIVQGIFSKYSHLYKKCDVAMKKDMNIAKTISTAKPDSTAFFDSPATKVNVEGKTITLGGLGGLRPRTMIKRSSVGA